MIPVGTGRAFRQLEGVDAVRSRRHGVHRIAILVGRHRHAVPVDGACLTGNAIGEGDLDVVALESLDQRAGARPVIGEDRSVLILGEARDGGFRRQPRLELTGRAGLIGKQRQFAQRLAFRQGESALRHGAHVVPAAHIHARHGVHVGHVIHFHLRQRPGTRQSRQPCHQKFASMHVLAPRSKIRVGRGLFQKAWRCRAPSPMPSCRRFDGLAGPAS